jgi:hypothetical protein
VVTFAGASEPVAVDERAVEMRFGSRLNLGVVYYWDIDADKRAVAVGIAFEKERRESGE